MAMNAAINPACSIQMKYTAVFPAMRYILQTKKREQVGRIFLLVSRASLTEMLYTIPCSSDFLIVYGTLPYSVCSFSLPQPPFYMQYPGDPHGKIQQRRGFPGKIQAIYRHKNGAYRPFFQACKPRLFSLFPRPGI